MDRREYVFVFSKVFFFLAVLLNRMRLTDNKLVYKLTVCES